ncbi:DUF6484 domain-containing protein [Nannocystaceae bacterium ST9]
MGSESAKQPGETPDDEVIESEGEDAKGEPATRPGDRSPGLLAELLEGAPREAPPSPRTRVGKLVAWTSGQAPRVEFEGNELGPLPARSTIRLDPTTILEAIAEGQGVLLSFEDGKPHAPIITGLLQPFDEEPPEVWQDEPEDSEAEATPISETEARVDGRRVEIEAADEIVLRCGEASIVLRRNGRVVIRGTYVETRSRGVNRVKGSTVEIN